MLPAVHRIRVAVGHHHVRQRGAVQDAPIFTAVPVGNLVQHQAVHRVNTYPERPVLPRDGVAFHHEARPFGLADGQRLRRRAQRRLAGGVVAPVFRRQGRRAVILQVRHAPGGEVHMRDEPLHRTGVAVVRLVFAHEGDGAVRAVAFRNARMPIAAGRPRIDLHMLEAVHAALSHGRLPAGIRLGDAHRFHHVGETDGRLPCGDAVNPHFASDQIHHGIESAIRRLRVVVADQPHPARRRLAGLPRLQQRFRRLRQRHRGKRGAGTEARPEQRRGTLDLRRRKRRQRVVRQFVRHEALLERQRREA